MSPVVQANDVDLEHNSIALDQVGEKVGKDDDKKTDQSMAIPSLGLESAVSSSNEIQNESSHQYATPKELSLLSTAFTIATFMIAIDGTILGNLYLSIHI